MLTFEYTLAGVAFIGVVASIFGRGWIRGAGMSVLCLALLSTMLGGLYSVHRLSPSRRLAKGECPTCGYSLRRLDPEPDGCTVCPECGAAWRLTEGTKGQRDKETEG